MKICYVCNKAVDDKETHECPQAKKLLENPVETKATYIHSDALPSIWRAA